MIGTTEFNPDYYASMAQVLPVLFLALVFEYRIFHERRDEPPALSLWLLTVTTLLLGGEVVVLTALHDQEKPDELLDLVPVMALGAAFLGFAYPIVSLRFQASSGRCRKRS